MPTRFSMRCRGFQISHEFVLILFLLCSLRGNPKKIPLPAMFRFRRSHSGRIEGREESARRSVSRVLSARLAARGWPFIWDVRCRTPRATYPGGSAETRPHRPYSVLLPVGFTVPPPSPAARCALTAPFHPCLAAAEADGRAVCFLWHFPWGRPRRALPGTVFPWSPDFPPPAAEAPEGGHPTVWRP